jgi:hypothetical protein
MILLQGRFFEDLFLDVPGSTPRYFLEDYLIKTDFVYEDRLFGKYACFEKGWFPEYVHYMYHWYSIFQ